MRWTRSQKDLIALAEEPVKDFSLDIVEVHHEYSGISTALRHIRKSKSLFSGSRNLVLESARPWDALMNLVKLAGPKTYGCGWLDIAWRTLTALSGDKKQPLVLWLEDARYMKPHERETLVCLFEHVCAHNDIPARLVMLVGKTRVWDMRQQSRVSMFVHSARLDNRARRFEYTREGLDEITQGDLHNDLSRDREGAVLQRKVG